MRSWGVRSLTSHGRRTPDEPVSLMIASISAPSAATITSLRCRMLIAPPPCASSRRTTVSDFPETSTRRICTPGTVTVLRPRLQCSTPRSTHTRVRPCARTTADAEPPPISSFMAAELRGRADRRCGLPLDGREGTAFGDHGAATLCDHWRDLYPSLKHEPTDPSAGPPPAPRVTTSACGAQRCN